MNIQSFENQRRIHNTNIYTAIVLIVFHTVLLITFVNIAIGIAYYLKDRKTPIGPLGAPERYTREKLQKVYPGYSWETIQQILVDSWNTPKSEYHPHTEWLAIATTSTYFNVHESGFRFTKNQGPWPPREDDFVVFFFGGSTTLGSGIPDDETIPSHFQEMASTTFRNRHVYAYNFGQGSYYSVQERILFEELLLDNITPDAVVFIDGINEFGPGFGLATGVDSDVTRELHALGNRRNAKDKLVYYFHDFLYHIPMVRLANSISLRLGGVNFVERGKARGAASFTKEQMEDAVKKTLTRYERNQDIVRGVSRMNNSKPLFVIQPHPHYKYNAEYNVFSSDASYPHVVAYTRMEERIRNTNEPDVLWLGAFQEDKKKALYVDGIHYTSNFNKEIGTAIYAHMKRYGYFR